jgi:hypothetical protein
MGQSRSGYIRFHIVFVLDLGTKHSFNHKITAKALIDYTPKRAFALTGTTKNIREIPVDTFFYHTTKTDYA